MGTALQHRKWRMLCQLGEMLWKLQLSISVSYLVWRRREKLKPKHATRTKYLRIAMKLESRYTTYRLGNGNPVRKFRFWQIACIQTLISVWWTMTVKRDQTKTILCSILVLHMSQQYKATLWYPHLLMKKKRKKYVSFEWVEQRKMIPLILEAVDFLKYS